MAEMSHDRWKRIIERHMKQIQTWAVKWALYKRWYEADDYDEPRRTGFGGFSFNVGLDEEESQDDDEFSVHHNYVYTFSDSLISEVCPSNPKSSVQARNSEDRKIAQAREALINFAATENDLADLLEEAAIMAVLTGRTAMKQRWDVEDMMPVSEMVPPTHYFYDYSARDIDKSRYFVHMTMVPLEDVKERFEEGGLYADNPEAEDEITAAKYPAWLAELETDDQGLGGADRTPVHRDDEGDWVQVFECYDLREGKFYHIVETAEDFLYAKDRPYEFVKLPFAQLVFNRAIMSSRGLSDARLIEQPLKRLNEIDSIELDHAHRTMPVGVFDATAFEEPEGAIHAVMKSETGGWVSAPLAGDKTLRESLMFTPVPGTPPGFEIMRGRMTGLIETTLGTTSFARGQVGEGKVATEFALANNKAATRAGRRENSVRRFARKILIQYMQLWEEFLKEAEPIYAREKATDPFTVIREEDIEPRTSREKKDQYAYDLVAYSPTEDNKAVQRQKLQTYFTYLQNHPNVKQGPLMQRLLDALELGDLYQDAPVAPEGAPGMGMPGMPGMTGGEGMDTLATGAVPGDLDEAVLPGNVREMADQPNNLPL